MRPNSLVLHAYFFRGARLWLAIRVLVSALFLLGGTNPLRLSTPTVLDIILLSVVACVLETRRNRERAFLGNLGVRPFLLGALFAAPAAIGEAALWIGAAAVR